MVKVLLVDDEDQFRISLARRLKMRGYETVDVNNGADAIKAIRLNSEIDVVVLDRKMPDLTGEQTLKEMKAFRPELQAIILTGYGDAESAVEAGRLDAYTYLTKPYDLDQLIETIDNARQEKVYAMSRYEIPAAMKGSIKDWLLGSYNSRPGLIILACCLFAAIVFTPATDRLLELLSAPKTGQLSDPILGYAGYVKMKEGDTITSYYSRNSKLTVSVIDESGKSTDRPLSIQETAFRAKVMLGILVISALFWATGAIPIGIAALNVGVLMYFFGVLKPDDVANSFAKDAVFFIFGVLAISKVITKTGLDRRIGLLLLGKSTSLPKLLFFFLPLLAVVCSFVSEHAMIAFIMPLFMMVYTTSIAKQGIKQDRALATMFVLSLCYTANIGGPGSPAAGGRNAVMVGILSDYGNSPTFGQWVMYGMPFVPVMALVIAMYFFIAFRSKIKVKTLNVSSLVRQASEKIGPMTGNEYLTAGLLILLCVLWVTCSDRYGMGGPAILCIVLLNVFRLLSWRDITKIQWDVVALYASACAIGKGLAESGAALYMADTFVGMLPDFLSSGEGLAIASSLFTGIVTNFMSDGATVSAIGPITVPMATITGTHPWMVGLATAFASSFAHMFIIGTPNNAIAYAMAKDPVTGEQLVSLYDFMKHGAVVLVLSMAILWGWTIMGYWRWIGF